MFSIIIRNKNEGSYLDRVLDILTQVYAQDFDEIIIVDNNSTDNSLEIAAKYNCKVVNISNFSYGRAINMGISSAKNNYVLLLSAHTIPIGKSFFKNTLEFLKSKSKIAGIRYINSIDNYERALKNNYIVKQPLRYGLMAACCIVVKTVWEDHKFNEDLEFSEDKEWSDRVAKLGFDTYEMDETFFYFIKRGKSSSMNRFKNETSAYYKMFDANPPSKIRIIASFFKKLIVKNPMQFFEQSRLDFKKAKVMLQINNKFRK